MHEPFRPAALHDEYRQAVLAAIDRKADGEDIVAADEPDAEPPDDLMAALQASLGNGRRPGKGASTSKAKAKSGGTAKATKKKAKA
jgi:DNA end-binding protein Ku